MLVVKLHDGKTLGKLSDRDDFKLAARSFAVLRHQERKDNLLHSGIETRKANTTL